MQYRGGLVTGKNRENLVGARSFEIFMGLPVSRRKDRLLAASATCSTRVSVLSAASSCEFNARGTHGTAAAESSSSRGPPARNFGLCDNYAKLQTSSRGRCTVHNLFQTSKLRTGGENGLFTRGIANCKHLRDKKKKKQREKEIIHRAR